MPVVAALGALGLAGIALAADIAVPNDIKVTGLLKTRLPKTVLTKVNGEKIDGLCEVTAGSNLFYVDNGARYLIIGRVYRPREVLGAWLAGASREGAARCEREDANGAGDNRAMAMGGCPRWPCRPGANPLLPSSRRPWRPKRSSASRQQPRIRCAPPTPRARHETRRLRKQPDQARRGLSAGFPAGVPEDN